MFIIYYLINYLQEKNGTEKDIIQGDEVIRKLIKQWYTRGRGEISTVSETQYTAAFLGLITKALYKLRGGFSGYETSASLKPWSQTITGSASIVLVLRRRSVSSPYIRA